MASETPDILPPGAPLRRTRTAGDVLTDEQLDQLATVLDDVFRIPGTNFRFGIDAIIGLIPGLGDLLTSVLSSLMIYSAWQRGVPRVTMARMVLNVAIDSIVGSIPLFGDLFDATWKANRKNYDLLQRAKQERRPRHTAEDWVFLVGAIVSVLAIVAAPLVLLWWILTRMPAW